MFTNSVFLSTRFCGCFSQFVEQLSHLSLSTNASVLTSRFSCMGLMAKFVSIDLAVHSGAAMQVSGER